MSFDETLSPLNSRYYIIINKKHYVCVLEIHRKTIIHLLLTLFFCVVRTGVIEQFVSIWKSITYIFSQFHADKNDNTLEVLQDCLYRKISAHTYCSSTHTIKLSVYLHSAIAEVCVTIPHQLIVKILTLL